MPPDTTVRHLHPVTPADEFLAAIIECDRRRPNALVGQACGIATRSGLWVLCADHTEQLAVMTK